MTNTLLGFALAISLVPAAVPAQDHPAGAHHQQTAHGHQATTHSPYAAEPEREIQALSAEEIADLLSGAGMGLARAAELHHYPGPLHVRELGDPLELTPVQRKATDAIFDRMKKDAVELGETIVEAERELDGLFASGRIDQTSLVSRVDRIANLQGRLRATHLRAHLEMKQLLTAQQVAAYNRLRGYAPSHP